MSTTAKAKPKSPTRTVEISPYLWGRIGTVAKLDEITRQQVITAALIAYVDGDDAVGRYLNEIDPPSNYPKAEADQSPPLTVTLQGEAAEAIRKASRNVRKTPSHLAQIHCEASLVAHGVIQS